jgi:hypothetical protein
MLWLRSAHATQVHQEAEAPVWLPSLAVLFSPCYLIGWFQRASALWCAFLVLLPIPEKVSCHLLDTFRQLFAKRLQNDETIYSVWKYTRQKDQDMQIQDTVASLHVLNHFQQCKHATMSNIRNHWMEAKPSSWWGDWLEAVHDWWITTRREKL